MNIAVDIRKIIKKYGATTVIDQLDLEIKEGELFTLLGPSGCGKTTLLRAIAGFTTIEGGEIFINNKVINNIPAYKRNIGMVFQDYAIFPHLTVFENVAYGLKARKVEKGARETRVDELLKTMHIAHLRDSLPKNISGGQQQRIALARAIVIKPSILLMDEPLSNLDAKLRVDMRTVIKEIQSEFGITTVYVTHDQEEALAISDRIAVMDKGVIKHIGSPVDIYSRPNNKFVSDFIGQSNFFSAHCEDRTITIGDYSFSIANMERTHGEVLVSVKTEEMKITNSDANSLKGEIRIITFLGRFTDYKVVLSTGQIIFFSHNAKQKINLKSGDTISFTFDLSRINIFDITGERSLIKDK